MDETFINENSYSYREGMTHDAQGNDVIGVEI